MQQGSLPPLGGRDHLFVSREGFFLSYHDRQICYNTEFVEVIVEDVDIVSLLVDEFSEVTILGQGHISAIFDTVISFPEFDNFFVAIVDSLDVILDLLEMVIFSA